jgi:pSer/pThr/pTyr-binding forkhead associated (FHA) protein
MDVKLVVTKGTRKKQTIPLRTEETIVGRQKGCDLRIPAGTVSRRHCLLRFRDDFLTVEDLDSANGTYLNGERITGREVVRPGDKLEVGPLVFVVQYQLTQAAIDRLLRGDPMEMSEADFVDGLVLAEGDPNTVKVDFPAADSKIPVEAVEPEEVVEAIPILEEDVGGWQLPEPDDLRNILSRLEDK